VQSQTNRLQDLAPDSVIARLGAEPRWHALLQLKNGKPRILDRGFLISADSFSPERELRKTLDFFSETSETQCRFPARKKYLERELKVSFPEFPCPDFELFLEKAPADDISLIYTSENLASASSMMGHIMLKTSGVNEDGIPVEHGVSFFTDLNTFNVPLLMWRAMVSGKKGFFRVTPFSEQRELYLEEEQRNIWEFHLSLDAEDKGFIQAYLWELRQTDLPYFFQKYNCATLTQLILSIIEPELLTKEVRPRAGC